MVVVNITGTQSSNATWDVVTDEYHITGNVTINSGVTITISVATSGTVIPIRFDGTYVVTTNGAVSAIGTRAKHIIFKSNSSTPQDGDWSYFTLAAGATGSNFTWCEFHHASTGILNLSTTTNTHTTEFLLFDTLSGNPSYQASSGTPTWTLTSCVFLRTGGI